MFTSRYVGLSINYISMHYLVGLGNPGERYQNTRHNVGWYMVREFIALHGLPQLVSSSKYAGEVSEGMLGEHELTCLLPTTYMNKSGSAVAKLVPKNETSNLIVVYDDVDLPIGELKVSVGRGAGGHNGIQSIIEALGSKDFTRIRIGVAGKSFWTGKTKRPNGERLAGHVLGRFTAREQKALAALAPTFNDVVATIVEAGVEQAMNQFN